LANLHGLVCCIDLDLDGAAVESALWQLRGSFRPIAASALATAVVSRLFSILLLHPPASMAGLKPDDLDCSSNGSGYSGLRISRWILGALLFAAIHTAGRVPRTSASSRNRRSIRPH